MRLHGCCQLKFHDKTSFTNMFTTITKRKLEKQQRTDFSKTYSNIKYFTHERRKNNEPITIVSFEDDTGYKTNRRKVDFGGKSNTAYHVVSRSRPRTARTIVWRHI